ncbi:MAG: sterol desaturase family protein [Pseudomonadota bacterium]
MLELFQTSEVQIRLVSFAVFFFGLAWLEAFRPFRRAIHSRFVRWINNLTLMLTGTLILRLLFPAATFSAAVITQENGWGVLAPWVPHSGFAIILWIIVLDLGVYLQHLLFHAIPLLWRLHRVHHSDEDLDLTTGLRFHPLEIVLSLGFKTGLVLILGPPLAAVIAFEVLLNATSMFSHSNISLPRSLDRYLRWLVVTPGMHRIHHSPEPDDSRKNFGFNLSIWDRIFTTYQEPNGDNAPPKFGVGQFHSTNELYVTQLLTQPFRGGVDSYPILRKQQEERHS